MESLTFSVIIPVFNCADTLRQAVESVRHQLGKNDEIIIVDDASTDATLETARSLEREDPRIQLVALPRNSGNLAARCEGAKYSHGAKVLSLDADDEFDDGLIQTLRYELAERDYDVIHFGMEVLLSDGSGVRTDETITSWYDSYPGALDGPDVFRECFVQRNYLWNLANKCVDGTIYRRACGYVPTCPVRRGDDAYLYFVIAYFAKSYLGLKGKRLYRYNLGKGQDTEGELSAAEYTGICDSVNAVRAMEEFLRSVEADDIYWEGLEGARRRLTTTCANKIRRNVVNSDQLEALHTFAQIWGWPSSLAAMDRAYGQNVAPFFQHVQFPKERRLRHGDTVAAFFWRLPVGAEKLAFQRDVDAWNALGLNVVLLLVEAPDESEAHSLGVPYRVMLDATIYEKRVEALEKAIEELHIRGIIYNQWLNDKLCWDMVLFKDRGLPFFIYCHGMFAHHLACGSLYFVQAPWSYGHSDGIISLCEVDASYWKLYNPRSYVIENPLLLNGPKEDVPARVSGHHVLWLGQLTTDEHPEEALEVFAHVRHAVPDASLTIIGNTRNQTYVHKLQERARALDIITSVAFVDWEDDYTTHLEMARALLITSGPKAGYPIAVSASRAFRIPGVLYDLPFCDHKLQEAGIETVEWGDRKRAAERITSLLLDNAFYQRQREQACDTATRITTLDIRALWSSILFADSAPEQTHLDMATVRRILQTILRAFQMGRADLVKRHKAEERRLCVEIQNSETSAKQELLDCKEQVRELLLVQHDQDAKVRRLEEELSLVQKERDDAIRQLQESHEQLEILSKSTSRSIGSTLTKLPRKIHRLFDQDL